MLALVAVVVLQLDPSFEVTVYPLSPQIDGVISQQLSTAATVAWRPSDGFALVATVMSSYAAWTSGWDELVSKARYEALNPLLTDAYVGLGTELQPLSLEVGGLRGAFVLSSGLGAVSTRTLLKPRNEAGPATYGDAGWRVGWSFGIGARVELNDWLALRLDVRDFVTRGGVTNVNGCSRSDLNELRLRQFANVRDEGPISADCRTATFAGVNTFGDDDPTNDRTNADDVPLAYNVTQLPVGRLAHDVQLLLGLAVRF